MLYSSLMLHRSEVSCRTPPRTSSVMVVKKHSSPDMISTSKNYETDVLIICSSTSVVRRMYKYRYRLNCIPYGRICG